jgi:DNA modification methylase
MMGIELIHGDCLEKMKSIPDGSIDLTVTSPPYDNLRTYNGNNAQWNADVWRAVIKDLHRVTNTGGVVVWIVGDATIKGSETGTSFRQALWAMECGFNLHDTMIWNKPYPVPLKQNRYQPSMEYMFILSKGKPSTARIIKDKKNKGHGRKITGNQKGRDGVAAKHHGASAGKKVAEYGARHNVWAIDTTKGRKGHNHPASFPLLLASDHITSWSNTGDTVLDPFMGSGTTGVACQNLGRDFIGIEMDADYFEIARKRIDLARG